MLIIGFLDEVINKDVLLKYCVTAQDKTSIQQDILSLSRVFRSQSLLLFSPRVFDLPLSRHMHYYSFNNLLPFWKLPFRQLRLFATRYLPFHPMFINPLGPAILVNALLIAIYLRSRNIYILGHMDSLNFYIICKQPMVGVVATNTLAAFKTPFMPETIPTNRILMLNSLISSLKGNFVESHTRQSGIFQNLIFTFF